MGKRKELGEFPRPWGIWQVSCCLEGEQRIRTLRGILRVSLEALPPPPHSLGCCLRARWSWISGGASVHKKQTQIIADKANFQSARDALDSREVCVPRGGILVPLEATACMGQAAKKAEGLASRAVVFAFLGPASLICPSEAQRKDAWMYKVGHIVQGICRSLKMIPGCQVRSPGLSHVASLLFPVASMLLWERGVSTVEMEWAIVCSSPVRSLCSQLVALSCRALPRGRCCRLEH